MRISVYEASERMRDKYYFASLHSAVKDRVNKREHLLTVKYDLLERFPESGSYIESLSNQLLDQHNENMVKKLLEKGEFEQLFMNKKDPKEGIQSNSTDSKGGSEGKKKKNK